jgi:putative ABC transport system substrate-binding protein
MESTGISRPHRGHGRLARGWPRSSSHVGGFMEGQDYQTGGRQEVLAEPFSAGVRSPRLAVLPVPPKRAVRRGFFVDRRAFIGTLTGSLLAAPLAAEAQRTGIHRVGWIAPFGDLRPSFREAMRELGYIEGKTVAFETRNADGNYDQMPDLAAELVRSKVHIIVAVAPAAIRAAKDATSSIPIVMAYWGGPNLVESGVIASFTRPGGNVTGVHMLASALEPKRLELLVQAVPAAKKIAVLSHDGTLFEPQLIGLRSVAPSLRVELRVVPVREAEGYEGAFDAIAGVGAGALVVPTAPKFERDRKLIFDLAARRRVPAIYFWGSHATEGGLMGYGPNRAEMDRQAARAVDRILKGAKPGDLPVEQPTKFELVINLKTAKALGLTIPPALMQRADQVIE